MLLQLGRPMISWAASKGQWPAGKEKGLSLSALMKPCLEYSGGVGWGPGQTDPVDGNPTHSRVFELNEQNSTNLSHPMIP